MRVSPVDLNACGSCHFQPLINVLRPNEPTIFDDIRGDSVKKNDLATLLFNTINNLNQGAYGPKDRVTSAPGLYQFMASIS